MKTTIIRFFSLLLALFLVYPSLAAAQKPAGVVTALKGRAQLKRTGIQTALRFEENVILQDIIDTQERSLVRVLFGGKSTVTVRELSRLEVREETLPTGAVRSVHELSSGSILVNVARRLMGKGEEVEIRTPNAVAAIRGTVIFVQYNAALAQSTFAVLTGNAVITPHGLPPVTLTPDTAVSITGDVTTGVKAASVVPVSQGQADTILQESETGVAVTEEANQEQTAQAQIEEAAQLASVVVEASTGETVTTSSETDQTDEETTEESEAKSNEQNSETVETTSTEPTTEGIDTSTTEPTTELTTTTTTTENPVASAPVTAGGTGETITASTQTPEISLSGETKILGPGETLFTFTGASSSSASPFIQVINSTISQTGSGLIIVSSGANVTLTGQLLDLDPSTLNTGGEIVKVESGGSLSLSQPLFTDVGGTITAGTDVLAIAGGSVTGSGTNPFIQFSNSAVSIGNDIAGMGGGSLTLSGPLLNASGGSLTFASLINLSGGASLEAGGPFLDITNLTLDLGTNPLVDVTGLSTLKNTAGPVFKVTGGSLTADAIIKSDESGNTFNLTGTILDLTNTSVTLRVLDDETSMADLDNLTFSLAANEPFFKLDNSTLSVTGTTTFGESIAIIEASEVGPTFAGVAVIATNNSSVTNNDGGILGMNGVLNITTTNPLIQITGSSVSTVKQPFVEIEPIVPTNNITMAGPLMSVGSTLTSAEDLFRISNTSSSTGSTLTSNTTSPFIEFNNATVTVGSGTVIETHLFNALNSGAITLAGPAVKATNSTLNVSSFFLEAAIGGKITSTTTSPLVQLTNSPLAPLSTGFLEFLKLTDTGSQLNVAGTVLSATNSNLTATSLAEIFLGGQLNITSQDPVVLLDGGTHTLGNLFFVQGTTTDTVTGLGNFAPINGSSPIGALFKATNGAQIDVTGISPSINVDIALFEATLPVVELLGSATAQSKITTNFNFIDHFQSQVALIGPPIALDKGLITVNNGPLLTLRGGSNMTVTGDLLRLTNGSKITVVNAPLIRVVGVAPTGTSPAVSTLNVSGALVNFGGTGGNQIVVNNSITPTATLSGIPVSATSGGSISIGPNPVTNPALGTILVTGSLIEASNNGQVTISAP